MSINNVEFTRVSLLRENEECFKINAEFQFNGSGLKIEGSNSSQPEEYVINMLSSGSNSLESTINFPPSLNTPAPDPCQQRAVDIKFYDPDSGAYSTDRGKLKIQKSTCPPPGGSPTLETGLPDSIEDYGSWIKQIDIEKSGRSSNVTITTANIDNGTKGYRIVNNTSHRIPTTEGNVQTWAFAIREDQEHDSNNSFSFEFDTIEFTRGLPILFYKEGTPIENVSHSDALIWL